MAYDIHIAKNKELAQRNKPVLSIEMEEHELVFLSLSKNKYPMFQSMEDYFRDTTYYTTSIKNLSSELEYLIDTESNKNIKKLAEEF